MSYEDNARRQMEESIKTDAQACPINSEVDAAFGFRDMMFTDYQKGKRMAKREVARRKLGKPARNLPLTKIKAK